MATLKTFLRLSSLNNENFWDFAGLDNSELINPSYRFPEEEGTFPVCLKVTSEYGCVDSICHEIKIIDIDYFKQVNDQYGHSVGDELLKIFANCAKESLRDVDFTARYAGDETL